MEDLTIPCMVDPEDELCVERNGEGFLAIGVYATGAGESDYRWMHMDAAKATQLRDALTEWLEGCNHG